MRKPLLLLLLSQSILCAAQDQHRIINRLKDAPASPVKTVIFESSDKDLKRLYDLAELKCLANIQSFGKYKVLVEGAGYSNVWLETQPMGGAMYANRDIQIAKNNQLIFIDNQREDGKMPGMISIRSKKIYPHYGWLQGFCFPEPALDVYYWLYRDRDYLIKLYNCLEKFDSYLWRVRDSDGDGCLESWCVYDTGDDNSVLLDGAPFEWPYESAPTEELIKKYAVKVQEKQNGSTSPVPMESMDVMSYSYTSRATLATISNLLNNGQSSFWSKKAQQVKSKIKSYLWDADRFACYDRDADNNQIRMLLNNNIRCMYYGSFDQQMADAFIKKHLFNPNEFWTNMPLPSIAVNDPAFRNGRINDWSGPPQGLTFQRAIKALENYGHYAEVPLIGERLIKALKQNSKFTQQYDPFTGIANNSGDGYGPTMLSLLGYISKMYGINYTRDKVEWSGLNANTDSTSYSQFIHGKTYKLEVNPAKMSAFINDRLIFSSTPNTRFITDLEGKLQEVNGIDKIERNVQINFPNYPKGISLKVKPNGSYKFNQNKRLVSSMQVPFT